ncbi:hypothetical protein MMC06_004321, partial [Schaereria dolodes]|nr:hypothetical protein [Schaereria dolodes]
MAKTHSISAEAGLTNITFFPGSTAITNNASSLKNTHHRGLKLKVGGFGIHSGSSSPTVVSIMTWSMIHTGLAIALLYLANPLPFFLLAGPAQAYVNNLAETRDTAKRTELLWNVPTIRDNQYGSGDDQSRDVSSSNEGVRDECGVGAHVIAALAIIDSNTGYSDSAQPPEKFADAVSNSIVLALSLSFAATVAILSQANSLTLFLLAGPALASAYHKPIRKDNYDDTNADNSTSNSNATAPYNGTKSTAELELVASFINGFLLDNDTVVLFETSVLTNSTLVFNLATIFDLMSYLHPKDTYIQNTTSLFNSSGPAYNIDDSRLPLVPDPTRRDVKDGKRDVSLDVDSPTPAQEERFAAADVVATPTVETSVTLTTYLPTCQYAGQTDCKSGHTLSKGVIVGIVIGAVAGGVVLFFL